MNKFLSLTKRNIKLFFASKTNVFFSMLSILILLALHFMIFRNMTGDEINESFSLAGAIIDKKYGFWLSDILMLSAIVPIGAVTVSLVALGQIVSDKETSIINDFYISPISRNTLLFSYLLSSFIIGLVVCVALTAFLIVYFILLYGVSFSFVQIAALVGIILISLLMANTFVMIVVAFVQRNQAMGAIGTILGTLLGFLAGAYVPVGVLGEGVASVLACLPFLPLVGLTRQIFLIGIVDTPLSKDMISGEFAKSFGIEIYFGDTLIPVWGCLLIVAAFILVAMAALIFIFKKMRKVD